MNDPEREILAERIRLGIGPEPVCLYVGSHGPQARCPICADWPRFDPTRREDKTARLALSYRAGAPIMPGLNLDDEPAPQPSRWRTVARWAGAVAMVVGAVSIMYAEGQRQPSPGVGFAIALALLMGAALLLGRSNDA